MATEVEQLVDRALVMRQRLEEQGLSEEAHLVEQLVQELTARQPTLAPSFYTATEAARIVGVTGQTIKNWVDRGILKGYRLGRRVVIPRAELDEYRAMAEAARAIDPLSERSEIIDEIRAGRRRFQWPDETQEHHA